MIFGINITSDISKLLYVISRAVRRVKCDTILKYHEWYLCMLLFVYTTTHAQMVCNFHMRFFKLSWNITALSQSNCRNFSCSSIKIFILLHEKFLQFDWLRVVIWNTYMWKLQTICGQEYKQIIGWFVLAKNVY